MIFQTKIFQGKFSTIIIIGPGNVFVKCMIFTSFLHHQHFFKVKLSYISPGYFQPFFFSIGTRWFEIFYTCGVCLFFFLFPSLYDKQGSIKGFCPFESWHQKLAETGIFRFHKLTHPNSQFNSILDYFIKYITK